jgi:hypothetical protein
MDKISVDKKTKEGRPRDVDQTPCGTNSVTCDLPELFLMWVTLKERYKIEFQISYSCLTD